MQRAFKTNEIENWLLGFRDVNAYYYFALLCLLQGALIFVQEDVVGFRSDFFTLIQTIGDEGGSTMLSFLWTLKIILGYLAIPIVYLFKCGGVALVLWLSAFGFGYKISFKFFFKLSLFCQPIFFIQPLLKIIWFGFISEDYSQVDLDTFFPLSLFALSSPEQPGFWQDLSIWISLPEMAFWYLLSVGIRLKYYRTLRQAFTMVASGYILFSVLFLWFSSVVFAS